MSDVITANPNSGYQIPGGEQPFGSVEDMSYIATPEQRAPLAERLGIATTQIVMPEAANVPESPEVAAMGQTDRFQDRDGNVVAVTPEASSGVLAAAENVVDNAYAQLERERAVNQQIRMYGKMTVALREQAEQQEAASV